MPKMTLHDYIVWLDVLDLIITDYEVDEYDEVVAITFSHGETLRRVSE